MRRYSDNEILSQKVHHNTIRTEWTTARKNVGDLSRSQDMVANPLLLRGDGDRNAKRRRFAERAVEFTVRSQRVASSTIREAAEGDDCDSED